MICIHRNDAFIKTMYVRTFCVWVLFLVNNNVGMTRMEDGTKFLACGRRNHANGNYNAAYHSFLQVVRLPSACQSIKDTAHLCLGIMYRRGQIGVESDFFAAERCYNAVIENPDSILKCKAKELLNILHTEANNNTWGLLHTSGLCVQGFPIFLPELPLQ